MSFARTVGMYVVNTPRPWLQWHVRAEERGANDHEAHIAAGYRNHPPPYVAPHFGQEAHRERGEPLVAQSWRREVAMVVRRRARHISFVVQHYASTMYVRSRGFVLAEGIVFSIFCRRRLSPPRVHYIHSSQHSSMYSTAGNMHVDYISIPQ